MHRLPRCTYPLTTYHNKATRQQQCIANVASGKAQLLPPAGVALGASVLKKRFNQLPLSFPPAPDLTLLGSTCDHTCRTTSLDPPINGCYSDIPAILENVLHAISDLPVVFCLIR